MDGVRKKVEHLLYNLELFSKEREKEVGERCFKLMQEVLEEQISPSDFTKEEVAYVLSKLSEKDRDPLMEEISSTFSETSLAEDVRDKIVLKLSKGFSLEPPSFVPTVRIYQNNPGIPSDYFSRASAFYQDQVAKGVLAAMNLGVPLGEYFCAILDELGAGRYKLAVEQKSQKAEIGRAHV